MNIFATNAGYTPLTAVVVKAQYPRRLADFGSVSGGGVCSGTCKGFDTITWTLGTLAAGQSVAVNLQSTTDDDEREFPGDLFTLFAEVRDDSGRVASATDTVMFGTGTADNDADGIDDVFDGDDDNDGMPDSWETAGGLNPLVDDAAGDADNDGISNIDEFNAGTDPSASNLPGDANLDGEINVSDLLLVMQHVVGLRTLSGTAFTNADLHPAGAPDGTVGISDLLKLERL